MNYMLDTHAFIWSVIESGQLPISVRDILKNPDHDIYVSAISLWEISLKYSIGKLAILDLTPVDFFNIAVETGYNFLQLTTTESTTYHQLGATWHKDPFDRMLIWQAIQQNLTLITKDEYIQKYTSAGLKVLW